MSLQDQLENLEAIKLLCPKYNEELKEKALKLVRKWDKERGEGWSDDSCEIADIMVEFFKDLTNERD
jgi:hypothetical protein